MLDRIGDSLTSAEQLLSGLLDISKLDAGALPVHRETFAADTLLSPLVREFAALAAIRGLSFRYRPTQALLHSDPALLRRVLLGVRHTGEHLRIEVWDTGPGIAPTQQRAVFEEFRPLQTQDAIGERGLALGLAISERIAMLLAGDLKPLSDPAENERGSDRQARVLVVDNEPLALGAITALLQRWGHAVVAAGSAAEAFECCGQAPPPDLVLVDYHLDDGESGIEAAIALRSFWHLDVPCVVLTADPTRGARDAAAEQGFALLQKPVRPAALRALLQRLLTDRASDQPH